MADFSILMVDEHNVDETGGGRLLADHPISATRFKNILQKESRLQPTDGI